MIGKRVGCPSKVPNNLTLSKNIARDLKMERKKHPICLGVKENGNDELEFNALILKLIGSPGCRQLVNEDNKGL